MAIALRHHFIGLFGGGVEAHGVVRAILGRERNFGIGAINARGTRVDKVLNSMLATALEDIGKPNQIGLSVSGGIFEAVTNPSLGC